MRALIFVKVFFIQMLDGFDIQLYRYYKCCDYNQCLQLKTFSNDFHVLESLENYTFLKFLYILCFFV